ncbi:hypothetical protein BK022_00320 [Methylorubrum extorquens]|uniref:Uncharacterized protein n=1 Tax=Methylorubrum extorquens TaxID=408 RepID=A0A1S1P992_METEX|nr:hypothetical protein BK022_00320 [Methylorubrum extorquens]
MTDSSSPNVGIFWGVPDKNGTTALAVDRTPLSEAEPYGDCLTHPGGHYEVWEAWSRLGPAGLQRRGLPPTITGFEYEECPRGRIVYDRKAEAFVIYADRRLQDAAMVTRIVEAFGLAKQRYSVRSDTHYR